MNWDHAWRRTAAARKWGDRYRTIRDGDVGVEFVAAGLGEKKGTEWVVPDRAYKTFQELCGFRNLGETFADYGSWQIYDRVSAYPRYARLLVGGPDDPELLRELALRALT